MTQPAAESPRYVSRAGAKLHHALAHFSLNVRGLIAADFGCSTGGFTDCLLRHGAAKVFAIDTGYGVLDYSLRKDARVVVMERNNAMHVRLPDPVAIITIDCSWTRQRFVVPNALANLAPGGTIITLIKPHYEADKSLLRKGVLPAEYVDAAVADACADIEATGATVLARTPSPIEGTGGNVEVLAMLRRRD